MNERLFINDNLIELQNTTTQFVRTLQVNDLAVLSNRQTNYTKNIKIPKTPNNILAMEYLNVMGNNSNVPYQQNNIKYFVDNDCLIYNGWGVVKGSNEYNYELVVYDGNIDFFKAIENKTITDVDVSALDHIKNLTNVLDSYTSTTLNYKYIVADYNGNNTYYNTGASTSVNVNIDYQIPSARISYIWDRIFTFTNFTYSGSVFSTEAFTNLWMTYPKPVPTDDPIVIPISSQDSSLGVNWNVDFTFSFYLKCFPATFDTPKADNTLGYIRIKEAGSYRLKTEGFFSLNNLANGKIKYTQYSSTNAIKATGVVNGVINESIILACELNDKLILESDSYLNNSYAGSVKTTFDFVEGYQTNFNEALIDFQVKDFVNEIMQRFGLTMFKDKYSNHIEFLTLKEILQGSNQLDWSDKFSELYSESYILNNYAQKNNFKYRYNDENQYFNDGFISIKNANLKDENTLIASKIYSPEYGDGLFGNEKWIYKFWDKEVQDDSTVKYKDLTGRYYFLREESFTTSSIKIGSKKLNQQQTVSTFPVASFDRLPFQQIIFDYYLPMESILDKAKVLLVDFYLKPSDIESFDFKKLVFVKQLGSYYLVNKITNYTSGKKTRCELLEVDYKKSIPAVEIPTPTGITINSIVTSGCSITLDYTTDALPNVPIHIIGTPNTFGGTPPSETQYYFDEITYATGTTNTVTFNVLAGQYWSFVLEIQGFPPSAIVSNVVHFENLFTCAYVPPVPTATYITITGVETLSILGNTRKVRINYVSDLPSGGVIDASATSTLTFVYPVNQSFYFSPTNGFVDIELSNNFFETTIPWNLKLTSAGITSNSVASLS